MQEKLATWQLKHLARDARKIFRSEIQYEQNSLLSGNFTEIHLLSENVILTIQYLTEDTSRFIKIVSSPIPIKTTYNLMTKIRKNS